MHVEKVLYKVLYARNSDWVCKKVLQKCSISHNEYSRCKIAKRAHSISRDNEKTG